MKRIMYEKIGRSILRICIICMQKSSLQSIYMVLKVLEVVIILSESH